MDARKKWQEAGSPTEITEKVIKVKKYLDNIYSEKTIQVPRQIKEIVVNGECDTEDIVIKIWGYNGRKDDLISIKTIRLCGLFLDMAPVERLTVIALFNGWISNSGQENPGH